MQALLRNETISFEYTDDNNKKHTLTGCLTKKDAADKNGVNYRFTEKEQQPASNRVKGLAKINGKTKQVDFSATFGSHTFSEKERNALLAGEEITIKNFKTRSGKILDIKGSLQEYEFKGKQYIGFQRTDIPEIKQNKRQPIVESKIEQETIHEIEF